MKKRSLADGARLPAVRTSAALVGLAFAAAAPLATAQSQTSGGGGATGQFQRHRMIVPTPLEEATDFTRDLFRDINRGVDAYQALKGRMQREYGLSWSAQVSYFLQGATPDGGGSVSQFVWSPSVSWTPFRDTAFGTGQFNVSFSQNQYWSRFTTPQQQTRIQTITAPNDWGANNAAWSQVSYTHTLPGAMSWLSVTAGQFGIGGFDGDLYAGNAQTSFVTYALAQNATQTYPVGGLGAYATVAIPNSSVSLSAGFQGATNLSANTITTAGFRQGEYAYFANILYTPTIPGLGAGSYNLVGYYQPAVSAQPDQTAGVSFAASQSFGRTFGAFFRANYASGSVLQIATSLAGGGVVNNPFGRHNNDQLGVGVFFNRANRSVVGSSSVNPRLWESGFETYYNYTLAKGLQVTPNFAVFIDPVIAPNRNAAYLFTLRVTAFF